MRRKSRPIVYVCSAIKDDNLISKMIESFDMDESYSVFEKEYGIKPQVVLGPFYKKKSYTLEKNIEVKFKAVAETKRGIYNGWFVTALQLESPNDSLYILFDRRVDGQKMQKPRSAIIKIKELQETK